MFSTLQNVLAESFAACALYKQRSPNNLCQSIEALTRNMQNMDVDQQQPQRSAKRSLVEEFIEEEVRQNKKSMSATRLELARAENNQEKKARI